MSDFLQRVSAEIHRRRLLPVRKKILVAVSGGADSLALLHVLHSLAQNHRWRIWVAHFNHCLRGRASDADERLVRRTAAALQCECVVGAANVKQLTSGGKLSIEMAARQARHDFLARTAREHKISKIALAHHADDQVELFFLRLLRGAGGGGLAGMKWCSPSPANSKITLVRPLLGFSKAEILTYARENKIRFRDDATNLSLDYLRNRVRNELLPLLNQRYQPGLSKSVLRLMEIVGAEAEFVSDIARQWLDKHDALGREQINAASTAAGEKGKQGHVASAHFENLPVALQRRILQEQLARLHIPTDFDLVEHLRQASEKWVSVSANSLVVRTAAGKVRYREHCIEDFRNHRTDEMKLELARRSRRFVFGGRSFRWQLRQQKSFVSPKSQIGIEFFDADRIGSKIILRHWRAGDRFQPIGMKSPVKLQDLFVNARIPANVRRKLVLAVTAAGEIFWVEGLRIGEHFKLTSQTRRKLMWQWFTSTSGQG